MYRFVRRGGISSIVDSDGVRLYVVVTLPVIHLLPNVI